MTQGCPGVYSRHYPHQTVVKCPNCRPRVEDQARSAWENAPRENRPGGYGMIGRSSFQTYFLVVRAVS
jgi:hypothetical protein